MLDLGGGNAESMCQKMFVGEDKNKHKDYIIEI